MRIPKTNRIQETLSEKYDTTPKFRTNTDIMAIQTSTDPLCRLSRQAFKSQCLLSRQTSRYPPVSFRQASGYLTGSLSVASPTDCRKRSNNGRRMVGEDTKEIQRRFKTGSKRPSRCIGASNELLLRGFTQTHQRFPSASRQSWQESLNPYARSMAVAIPSPAKKS